MQEGRTPLHYAAMCPDTVKSLNCYQLLLAHGAPENAKDAVRHVHNFSTFLGL